jgi:energy-coupling factor transport system ATP-binding protein
MQPMIQTDALSFSYPVEEGQRRTTALDNVTLSIEKGSFVVVLGHNGSGKSTLAKHMNAVLLPSGGAVYVEGMDTKKEELLLEIRRRVGMVFQNPDNQIVANVVEEDVAFAPENLGVPTAEIRRRVDDALAAVGMTEFTRHAPHLLSGGQKQRVAIAGVIAMEPECIVLDEATAMLDPSGRREVLDTVHRLNRERGITVVHITHHMSEAEDADRVIVMNDGVVAMDGTPRDIFSRVEELRSLGLAAPDTVELLRRLNRHGMDLPLTAITVDECARAIFQALHGAEGK